MLHNLIYDEWRLLKSNLESPWNRLVIQWCLHEDGSKSNSRNVFIKYTSFIDNIQPNTDILSSRLCHRQLRFVAYKNKTPQLRFPERGNRNKFWGRSIAVPLECLLAQCNLKTMGTGERGEGDTSVANVTDLPNVRAAVRERGSLGHKAPDVKTWRDSCMTCEWGRQPSVLARLFVTKL